MPTTSNSGGHDSPPSARALSATTSSISPAGASPLRDPRRPGHHRPRHQPAARERRDFAPLMSALRGFLPECTPAATVRALSAILGGRRRPVYAVERRPPPRASSLPNRSGPARDDAPAGHCPPAPPRCLSPRAPPRREPAQRTSCAAPARTPGAPPPPTAPPPPNPDPRQNPAHFGPASWEHVPIPDSRYALLPTLPAMPGDPGPSEGTAALPAVAPAVGFATETYLHGSGRTTTRPPSLLLPSIQSLAIMQTPSLG